MRSRPKIGLAFSGGGVDNQDTLTFASVEDERLEVMNDIRILGDEGGYILAPCHNIQAVSPPENIVACMKLDINGERLKNFYTNQL